VYNEMRRIQMAIVRGWVPVSKLEFNILVKGDALGKMGFPKVETDKVEATFRARKELSRLTEKLAKVRERTIQELLKGEGKEQPIGETMLPNLERLSCDICNNSVYWVFKRFAPESYHGDWTVMRFVPERADKPQITQLTPAEYDGERTYSVMPPAVAIDYNGGKVYVMCGLCQFRAGLKEAESGLLIHEIRGGAGYIDLDTIERLIREVKEE
jgi:hypothetical protein